MLLTLDSHWKEHLAAMDYLRQGIHLRGYAQQNPKQEYKKEAFEMFTKMLGAIKQEVIEILCKMQLQAPPSMNASQADFSLYNYKHDDYNEMNQINEKNNRFQKYNFTAGIWFCFLSYFNTLIFIIKSLRKRYNKFKKK